MNGQNSVRTSPASFPQSGGFSNGAEVVGKSSDLPRNSPPVFRRGAPEGRGGPGRVRSLTGGSPRTPHYSDLANSRRLRARQDHPGPIGPPQRRTVPPKNRRGVLFYHTLPRQPKNRQEAASMKSDGKAVPPPRVRSVSPSSPSQSLRLSSGLRVSSRCF
jgi:hypothetical protein